MTQITENETKQQTIVVFVRILLDMLICCCICWYFISLLGNMMLAGTGVTRVGNEATRVNFLILPHPLTNFEMQEHYQKEPKFKGANSRNNLPKTMKAGDCVINLEQ